ncbi:MAG: pilus assembly protein [Lachnospiraceae bacterium]|nr:pilus assembly protein [Lachnospiraceae bacterium]
MNNKKNDTFYKQGSVTVEASLIMPLILASIIFVIYIAFYEHDKCMMLKAGFSSALRAERGNDEALSYSLAEEAADEVIGVKTTGFTDIDTNIEVTYRYIRTDLRGNMRLSGIAGLLTGSRYPEYSIMASGSLEDPAEHIRLSRKWGVSYCY